MKRTSGGKTIHDFFTVEEMDHTAVIRIEGCPFDYGTDLDLKNNFLKCFDDISRNESLKSVLLFGPTAQNGCERYFKACRRPHAPVGKNFSFERLQNAVSQYVTKIIKLNKFVIHVDRRNKIPLFMNLGLACDYRIISRDALFHTRNLEMGFLPKGGEMFFLKRILGFKKTLDVFLFGKEIPAQEALDMELVNETIPADQLEEAAFRVAGEIAKKPAYMTAGIKRLMNHSTKGIQEILEQEKRMYTQLLYSNKFQEKIAACSWNGE